MSERFLWDLRQTAQELVIENHALRLKELGHRHGLGLSIEPYDMNPCADLTLGGAADVPMCEFWAGATGSTPTTVASRPSRSRTRSAARSSRPSRSPPGRRALAALSRRDEGAGRLGVVHGRQPHRLSPLSAPAVARPPAGHDDGAVRRALGAHADVVGHGRRRITTTWPAASTCCGAGCPWPTSSIWLPKARRTSSGRRLGHARQPARPARLQLRRLRAGDADRARCRSRTGGSCCPTG